MSETGLPALFTARLAAADGRVHRCPDGAAAVAALRAILAQEGQGAAGLVAPAAEALLPGLAAAVGLGLLAPDTTRAALAGAAIVVSGAATLVAETGSVLLTADRAPVRSATVLARRHVVVAREADLVPDLAAALERHPPGAGGSWSGFVTGPSRTADIEKRLVLGVHGPLALDVLLLAR